MVESYVGARAVKMVLAENMVNPLYFEMPKEVLKPVECVGSSKGDLKKFPAAVQDQAGFALYQAQAGLKHRDAKPLKGLGAHVLEIVSRHDGDTYRAVYTVRFKAAVYVLHAFQKKAKRGIETPRHGIDLVKHRLKAAEQHYTKTYGEEKIDKDRKNEDHTWQRQRVRGPGAS